MLAKQLNINEPFFVNYLLQGWIFDRSRDLLATRADSAAAVSGDDWFYYGTHYGEYLWNTETE